MFALVSTGLLLLTALNYYVGRSIFYPAFVYCATWTLSLFCLLASGNMFFPISAETLEIFMWGAIAFTLGCAAGKIPRFTWSRPEHRDPGGMLTLVVTVFVAAFPFYVLWLFEVIADKPGVLFLPSVRDYFVTVTPAEYTWKFKFFINILTSTFLVSLIAWNAKKGHKKRAIIAAIVACLYSLLTGGRATTIQIILSLLCIEWLATRRLQFRSLAALCISSALIFGIAGSFKNTGADDSLSDKASAMSKEFIGYVGGPLVAFDRVVRHPNSISHFPKVSAYFVETAAKFWPDIEVPPRIAEFVATGPDRKDNVYTIYFSYFDTGVPVTLCLVAAAAFLLSILYRFALAGGQTAVVMYAAFFGCIAFSTFTDIAAANVATLLRTYIACWLFYSFPFIKARFGRFLHEAAKDHIEEISSQCDN